MGHSDITTTLRYCHPARAAKVFAVEKLEKYIELAKQFHGQEVEEAEGDALWGIPTTSPWMDGD